MKFVERPPIDANGVGHGPDDLDEALFAFFRSEMPDPWPEVKLPSRVPSAPPVRLPSAVPSPSRRPWFRSPRFALAASVALLIGGYAVMSSALAPPVAVDAIPKDSSGSPKPIIDEIRNNSTKPAPVVDDQKWKTRVKGLQQNSDGTSTILMEGEIPDRPGPSSGRFPGR